MRRYAALIWPIVGTVVMAVLMAYKDAVADQHVTASEWVLVLIAAVSVVQVWLAANLAGYTKIKPIVQAVMAVLGLLVAFITNGLTTNEIIELIILFLSTVGVVVQPGPTTATPVPQVTQNQS